MVGAKVGNGAVGVKVGHKAPMNAGKVVPVRGTVGAVVGAKRAVGQNAKPPRAAVRVGVKVVVGAAIRPVIPGVKAGAGAVATVVNGGKIKAKAFDDKRLKIIHKNRIMRKNLYHLIYNPPKPLWSY